MKTPLLLCFGSCYFCRPLLIAVLGSSCLFPAVPDTSAALVLAPSSCCPRKLRHPSRGPSGSGCSVAAESCQCRESYHFSCTSVTDAVGMSKQTPCFPLKKTIPFTSITNVWHFNRALQDHGHKARFWVAQADVAPDKWARAAAGASRAPFSPVSFSADCSKWPRAVGGRVPESDGIFARSFYYLCCRRNTYSFKFDSRFLLHLG